MNLQTFTHPVWAIGSGEQLAAELIFGGAALATLIYCLRTARRLQHPWPLFVFGGAALTVVYEPFNNLLGHCGYPTIGQHTYIELLGRQIPLFIGFVYMFYFAAPVTWLVQRFDAGVTRRQLAKYYLVGMGLAAAFEPLFCNGDLPFKWWFYYGHNQPLAFTGLPVWWWFLNPMCVFANAALFHALKKHVLIKPLETALFVPLGVLSVFATHFSAGVPTFIAITDGTGRALTTLGSLGSIAICLTYMWLIARLITVPATETARERERVTVAAPLGARPVGV